MWQKWHMTTAELGGKVDNNSSVLADNLGLLYFLGGIVVRQFLHKACVLFSWPFPTSLWKWTYAQYVCFQNTGRVFLIICCWSLPPSHISLNKGLSEVSLMSANNSKHDSKVTAYCWSWKINNQHRLESPDCALSAWMQKLPCPQHDASYNLKKSTFLLKICSKIFYDWTNQKLTSLMQLLISLSNKDFGSNLNYCLGGDPSARHKNIRAVPLQGLNPTQTQWVFCSCGA